MLNPCINKQERICITPIHLIIIIKLLRPLKLHKRILLKDQGPDLIKTSLAHKQSHNCPTKPQTTIRIKSQKSLKIKQNFRQVLV